MNKQKWQKKNICSLVPHTSNADLQSTNLKSICYIWNNGPLPLFPSKQWAHNIWHQVINFIQHLRSQIETWHVLLILCLKQLAQCIDYSSLCFVNAEIFNCPQKWCGHSSKSKSEGSTVGWTKGVQRYGQSWLYSSGGAGPTLGLHCFNTSLVSGIVLRQLMLCCH